MITGVEHLAIASFHPSKLAEWYVHHLNFEVAVDDGKALFVKDPNGMLIEFIQAETRPGSPTLRDGGLRHIALSVDSLDKTSQDLQSKGIEFLGAPIHMPGASVQFFQDPEGNFLHLVERKSPLR